MADGKVGAALVVGGGIGGMQAALDLAASGIKVYLAERKASIGGVMAQLDKTFPSNDCAMCTMSPRLVEIGRHRDVEVLTLSEVERAEGGPGHFEVTLGRQPRYVDESRCTGCGTCTSMCPTRNRLQPAKVAAVELDPERRERVGAIIERHRGRKGPLMPILQEINEAYHYFPPEVLGFVAEKTGYELTHLYRIATFYSAFSVVPRGKHVVKVCMGTTCYVRGGERLMEKLGEVLEVKPGETTADGLFTLEAVRCIGCCGLAPAVMIGESVSGKLSARDIPDLVAQHRGGA